MDEKLYKAFYKLTMDDLLCRFRLVRCFWKLNEELFDDVLDFLQQLVQYCKEHNIPIWRQENIWSQLDRIRATLELIKKLNSKPILSPRLGNFPSDKFLQNRKSDNNLTEP